MSEGENRLGRQLVKELDDLRMVSGAPGASIAIVLPDQTVLKWAVGLVSPGESRILQSSDKMMSGSIGKTYFAALALELLNTNALLLDDKVSKYVGQRPGFSRLPNAGDITIGHLMRHQSGLPRYIHVSQAWTDLMATPEEAWEHGRQLEYVYDAPPVHPAGEGWAYSDTNYILLGLVLEQVTQRELYQCINEKYLAHLNLSDTLPNDRRTIAGLIQGHCQLFQPYGIPEYVIQNGKFVFDPSMEWCGGGYASTAADLARWAQELYSGRLLGTSSIQAMKEEAVLAPMLGAGTRYGLGVMVRETNQGELLGHDGVFPGYTSTMGYFSEHQIAVALMVNADGPEMTQHVNFQRLVESVGLAVDELGSA